ncbi:MAG: hypothetical protein ABII22_04980 [Candidatus Micrarchaeota archaeon]
MNLNKSLLFSSVFVFLTMSFQSFAQSYYNLQVGNYWSYTSAIGFGEFKPYDNAEDKIVFENRSIGQYLVRVRSIEKINGTDYFVLENGGYLSYLSIKNNKVFLLKEVVSGLNLIYDPPLLLFDFGSNSWSWQGTHASVACASNGMSLGFWQISTSIGSFTALRNTNLVTCSNGETRSYEYSFVNGVGVVGFIDFFGSGSKGNIILSLMSDYGKK